MGPTALHRCVLGPPTRGRGKVGYANRVLPTGQCDGDRLEVRITGDTRFDLEFVRR